MRVRFARRALPRRYFLPGTAATQGRAAWLPSVVTVHVAGARPAPPGYFKRHVRLPAHPGGPRSSGRAPAAMTAQVGVLSTEEGRRRIRPELWGGYDAVELAATNCRLTVLSAKAPAAFRGAGDVLVVVERDGA